MDAYLQQQICGRIKQARIEAGFTQDEMADLLHMSMRGYQNYESERVPWKQLDKIADLTNVTQEWLLRGDPAQETNGATPSTSEVIARIESLEDAVESLRQEIRQALGLAPSERRVAN